MGANPHARFYWKDWRTDVALSRCSLAAQGLWMRMLCIAAEADRVGYVEISGHPLSPGDISHEVREPIKIVRTMIAELEKAGVFSRDRDGTIFCRRMVKAERRRLHGVHFGKIGALASKLAHEKRQEKIANSENGQSLDLPIVFHPPSGGSVKVPVVQVVVGRNLVSQNNEVTEETSTIEEWFEQFYSAYPRKVGRRQAARAFIQALKRNNHPREIVEGARRYAEERKGEEPRYTKHPATWLNGDCWADEPAPDQPKPKSQMVDLEKV